jgi:hypothetical protein
LAKTANRLAVIFILPTATANRRLAVITGGLKPLSNSGFGPGLDRFWVGLKSVLGYFYTCFGPGLHLFWAIFCTDFLGIFFCADFLGHFLYRFFKKKNLILFGPFVLCYKITNPNIF